MALLGIDIGTTGTKAVAFTPEGKVLADACREYELHHPENGQSELDAEEVWARLVEAVREVSSRCSDITALGISAQGEAFAPVSADGKALGPAIVTFDNRALAESRQLIETFGREALIAQTGMPPSHICTLPKILWWRRHGADVFDQAARFLCFEDFAFMKMGLEPVIDHSLAARTMALDIRQGRWAEDLLGAAGIDESRMAKAAPSGTVVGTLGAKAAETLNLPKGTVAVTGGHDQTAGAFGCGIAQPGEGMYATGTVDCIAAVFGAIVTNETMLSNNLCCYPHVIEDTWASIAFNFTGGSLLKWYRDNWNLVEIVKARANNENIYDLMINSIPSEPTGLLVLPHFTSTGTPHMDPDPTGAIIGLTLATDKATVTKAILEGTTYEMKLNFDMLRDAGITLERLRAIGGGARSDAWLQIKADIMGVPVVRMQVTEAACLGVALLAGVATGVYGSPDDATAAACRTGKEFTPNTGRHARYSELLAGYRELYGALKKVKQAIGNANK